MYIKCRCGALLHFEDVKFLPIGDGIDDVGRQIAVAIKIAYEIGLPLTQRQCEVGAL